MKNRNRQETARSMRVDGWLAAGGVVLAATERAARSVAAGYHAARQAEGRTAWPTPAVKAWEGWVREQWLARERRGLVLLNAMQEQTLWERVIRGSAAGRALLHPEKLAAAAQQGYRLLCNYAPGALVGSARAGWVGDAAVFSGWVGDFEGSCRREGLISASRLGVELAGELAGEFEGGARLPLLLVGFDRLLPMQKTLLAAWGGWELDALLAVQGEGGETERARKFLAAPDAVAELEACVGWLRGRLAEDSGARLLVVVPGLEGRRGALERALRSETGLDFEFSLGVPLGQVGVARSALLGLRWLTKPLAEPEVDWLLTSGFAAANELEETALATGMRELRRRGLERTEWDLEAFCEPPGAGESARPPAEWAGRMLAARTELRARSRSGPTIQSPMEWAGAAADLLEQLGWPGFRPLGSEAFQARERWEKLLEECGTLGFSSEDAGMEWEEFLAAVAGAVSRTIFAAESREAAVQITEPAESAGMLADGVWFLGADEETWPGRGTPHPLLPLWLQREAGMPHGSPELDWELARGTTERLLQSADEVIFSYGGETAEGEARPSRLVARIVGPAAKLPELQAGGKVPLTETYDDRSLVRFPLQQIAGGAATLTSQSLCAFQAFGTARLGAQHWQAAEAGLNAKQRGQLLHAVLHRVWNREEGGLGSLAELRGVAELPGFVEENVRWAVRERLSKGLRDTLPKRFLELEEVRLVRLVTAWLEYERGRMEFAVAGTEISREVVIAGLRLGLRLDRVDMLADGTRLVIDYKTGSVGPAAWAGERPEDVQLPLYAVFAEPEEGLESLQGLVFARVRTGEMDFAGRVRDATGSLRADLGRAKALVKRPLDSAQLEEWRRVIERLGEEFLAGRAEVDPKDAAKTCEDCHLQAVCRIYENRPGDWDEEGETDEEGEDG